jgi:prenyltransferase beta subunit
MKRFLLAAVALAVAAAPLAAQADADVKKAAIEYLAKLRNADGGYKADAKQEKSSLRATSSALRAIKYFGGEAAHKDVTAKFVASCWDAAAGAFADTPGGKPEVAVTAVGLMAVVELKMDVEKYAGPAVKYLDENAKSFEEVRIAAAGFEAIGKKPARADRWLEEVKKTEEPQGAFGKGDGQARDTGGAVVTILRLGGKADKAAVLKVLDMGQRVRGGFGKPGAGSDLESTYRVMRCYHMLGAQPADAGRLRDFVLTCRNADGGFGVQPGQPSSASGPYFAAVVLHWLDKK